MPLGLLIRGGITHNLGSIVYDLEAVGQLIIILLLVSRGCIDSWLRLFISIFHELLDCRHPGGHGRPPGEGGHLVERVAALAREPHRVQLHHEVVRQLALRHVLVQLLVRGRATDRGLRKQKIIIKYQRYSLGFVKLLTL